MPKRRTVLVVGGRGFVGSHVVRHLLRAGFRVHLFGPAMADDLLRDLPEAYAETCGTVEDRAALRAAIEHSGADAVVTTAAYSAGRTGLMKSGDADGDRAFSINVNGLRNVLEAARQTGLRRVVWTSSTVVYGPPEQYPGQRVNEGAERAPITFYGLTKVLGEDLVRYYRDRHAMGIVALRLPLVLGRGLWYAGAASAIADMIASARPGGRYQLAFHDEAMDLMHVGDVADAVAVALTTDRPLDGIYNINGFTARLSDFVRHLEARIPDLRIEHRLQPPAISFPLIDDTRFRRDGPYTPARGLSEVVEDMLLGKDAPCTSSD